MKQPPLVIAGIVIVLTALVCFYWIRPAWSDYQETKRRLIRLHEQVDRQEQEIRRLNKEIAALRTDPYAVERVAREKFGWCRKGENIYHFDQSTPDGDGQRDAAPETGTIPPRTMSHTLSPSQ